MLSSFTKFVLSTLDSFTQAVEVCHLSFQGAVGAVKPKSAVGSAVDAQGPTNGIRLTAILTQDETDNPEGIPPTISNSASSPFKTTLLRKKDFPEGSLW
jgi:hypothetical protein